MERLGSQLFVSDGSNLAGGGPMREPLPQVRIDQLKGLLVQYAASPIFDVQMKSGPIGRRSSPADQVVYLYLALAGASVIEIADMVRTKRDYDLFSDRASMTPVTVETYIFWQMGALTDRMKSGEAILYENELSKLLEANDTRRRRNQPFDLRPFVTREQIFADLQSESPQFNIGDLKEKIPGADRANEAIRQVYREAFGQELESFGQGEIDRSPPQAGQEPVSLDKESIVQDPRGAVRSLLISGARSADFAQSVLAAAPPKWGKRHPHDVWVYTYLVIAGLSISEISGSMREERIGNLYTHVAPTSYGLIKDVIAGLVTQLAMEATSDWATQRQLDKAIARIILENNKRALETTYLIGKDLTKWKIFADLQAQEPKFDIGIGGPVSEKTPFLQALDKVVEEVARDFPAVEEPNIVQQPEQTAATIRPAIQYTNRQLRIDEAIRRARANVFNIERRRVHDGLRLRPGGGD